MAADSIVINFTGSNEVTAIIDSVIEALDVLMTAVEDTARFFTDFSGVAREAMAAVDGSMDAAVNSTEMLGVSLEELGTIAKTTSANLETIGVAGDTAAAGEKAAGEGARVASTGLKGIGGSIKGLLVMLPELGIVMGAMEFAKVAVESSKAAGAINYMSKAWQGNADSANYVGDQYKKTAKTYGLSYDSMTESMQKINTITHATGTALGSLAQPTGQLGLILESVGRSGAAASKDMADFYEVLQSDTVPGFMRVWAPLIGSDNANQVKEWGKEVRAGAMSVEEFSKNVSEMLNKKVDFKTLLGRPDIAWNIVTNNIMNDIGDIVGSMFQATAPIAAALAQWFLNPPKIDFSGVFAAFNSLKAIVVPMLTVLWQIVSNFFNGFASTIGPIIIPALQLLQSEIANMSAMFNNWLNSPGGQAVVNFLQTLGYWLGVVAGVITSLLIGAVILIVKNFESLGVGISLVLGFFTGLWSVLQGFYDGVLVPLGGYLMSVFAPAWTALSVTINDLWNSYLVPFGAWLSSVFSPLFMAMTIVIQQVQIYWNMLVGTVSGATKGIGGNINWLGLIWTAVSTTIMGIINRVIATINMIWIVVSNVFGLVGDIISGNWAGAWNRAGTIVSSLVNWVRIMVGNIPSILWGIISSVGQAALSIGQAIFNGIVNALTGIGNAIKNKIQGAVGGLGSWIGGLFGGKRMSYNPSFFPTNPVGGGLMKSNNSALGAVNNISNSEDNRTQTVNYYVNVNGSDVSEQGIIQHLNSRTVIDTINKNLELFK